MRLSRVELEGLTRFEKPAVLDLDAVGDGLVALVGPNGAGKTTVLESVYAGLYKAMPSYPGSIYDQIGRGGQARIQTRFVSDEGQIIYADVRLDRNRRSTDCFLTVDGQAVTSGKGRDFDHQVASRFGSGDLVLASVFAAQSKAGSFLSLARSERKALFTELLGLGRLAVLHKATAGRVTLVDREVQLVRGRAAELQKGETVEQAAAALALAEQVLEDAARELHRVTVEREQAAERMARREDVERARREFERLDLRAAAAMRRIELVMRRQQESYAEQADIDYRLHELAEVSVPEDAERSLGQIDDQVKQIELAEIEAERLATELAEARRARERLFLAYERDGHVHEAKRNGLVKRSAAIDQAPCASILAAEFQDGRGTWLVPFSDEPHDLPGTCPLLAGAREALTEIEELDRDVERTEQDYVAALAKLPTEEQLEEGQARLVELDRASLSSRRKLLLGGRDELRDRIGQHAELVRRRERATAAAIQVDEDLQQARDEHGDAMNAALAALHQVEDLARALEELGPPPASSDADLKRADDRYRTALRAVEAARAEEKQVLDRVTRLTVLQHDLRHQEGELDLLCDLAAALGPNGAPALAIDAAGPAITAIVDELLAETAFTVRLDTLREKVTGGQAEDLLLRVFERGEERPADKFSGGQKVFLGEALGLGLAIFNARRHGIRWRTIFRDETAGALDPEHAQAYVRMLRRALTAGGFRNVLFVSHDPAVWSQADAVVRVDGGEVRA